MKYSPKRVGRYKKLSLMSFRNVTVVYSACFLVTLYFQRSLSSEEDHKHCRKVLLQRGQNKAGFHRDLLTYVEWDINNIASNSEHKSCHLLLLEHLPNGIYVDPDQIRSGEEFGGPQVFSRDAVNVESLAHHASSNRIFVLPKMVVRMGTIITANVSLPVHLRYHQAAVNKKFMSVSLSPPTVLGRCNGYVIDDLSTNCGTETIKAPCYDKTSSDSCDWLILKSAIESTPLVFYVPVGQIDHVWPVVAFTVLSTMAGCAVVVWNSFTSTLDR
ncbi:phosphatidylinositol-glycan biosynthesis class X protein-like isoform X2 [Montipora capricornis]|uniref:phosphatidylinositol-glycan biosynthesis class X protein-like isoform X2 n=1 Tax=Montipora capricornis TaxID=246305 RepID=UPI0035F1F0F7